MRWFGHSGESPYPRNAVSQSITLHVSHPNMPSGKILGFRYMWAYYVNGYNDGASCQRSFRGKRVDQFSGISAASGVITVFDQMDHYPYVYLCGGSGGPKASWGAQNLHLPLKYAKGKVVQVATYNGYLFEADNAETMEIPSLGAEYDHLPLETRRCKNVRFAATYLPKANPTVRGSQRL